LRCRVQLRAARGSWASINLLFARRRDNRQPVKERVKFFCPDLHQDRDDKNDAEYSRANKIAGALCLTGSFAEPRHGHCVATGFPERCCEDLNDPERKRNLRNFTNNVVKV